MSASTLKKVEEGHTTKPDGGYVQVSTLAIGLLVWSHSKGLISHRAVRVGLALYELRIRRRAHAWTERKRGRGVNSTPHYSIRELAALCGLPEKRTRAALKELLALGLVAEFSSERLTFGSSLDALSLSKDQLREFLAWLPTLTKRKRIPLPRRILTLLVESQSPALISVILGACIRCVWLRPETGFTYSGRLSSAWLSKRFGVCQRAIQRAKAHLVGLGWIRATGNVGRFGELVALNPEWHRLISLPEIEGAKPQDQRAGGETQASRSPAPGSNNAGVEERPGSNKSGLSLIQSSPKEKLKYQRESPTEPRTGLGFFKNNREEKNQDHSPNALPPPRLSQIRTEDFREVDRALELFRQAVKCGLMPNGSEHSRLRWLAAIERARTVEARNPAGVLLHIVKGRKWDYLSEAHITAANERLKFHLFGRREDVPPLLVPRQMVERPRLSKDALLVQVIRNELAKRGQRDGVFTALRAHAGFSRERYQTALAELEKGGR